MKANHPTYKGLIPYAIAALVIFYAIPAFCKQNPGGDAMAIVMVLLLMMAPGYCLAGGLMYGWKNGFSLWFTAMILVLFFPSIFLFYNSSATIYLAIFGVLALAGTAVGSILAKKANK